MFTVPYPELTSCASRSIVDKTGMANALSKSCSDVNTVLPLILYDFPQYTLFSSLTLSYFIYNVSRGSSTVPLPFP